MAGAPTQEAIPRIIHRDFDKTAWEDWATLRWDYLQLLRLIDQLELSEPGTLSRGLDLMERAARDQDHKLDYQRDVAPFAWELRLANHGGYLVWEDLLSLG